MLLDKPNILDENR